MFTDELTVWVHGMSEARTLLCKRVVCCHSNIYSHKDVYPTCDSAHAWQLHSTAPLGNQAVCQHHDLISHSVTLSWHWAHQSLPYRNAEHRAKEASSINLIYIIGFTTWSPTRKTPCSTDSRKTLSSCGEGSLGKKANVFVQAEAYERWRPLRERVLETTRQGEMCLSLCAKCCTVHTLTPLLPDQSAPELNLVLVPTTHMHPATMSR